MNKSIIKLNNQEKSGFTFFDLPNECIDRILSFHINHCTWGWDDPTPLLKIRTVSKLFGELCCNAVKNLLIQPKIDYCIDHIANYESIKFKNDDWISQFKYLNRLIINSPYITHKSISNMKTLKHLSLINVMNVTGETLSLLPNLVSLYIDNKTSLIEIPKIESLTNLTIKNYDGNNLPDNFLNPLNIVNLSLLSIGSHQIKDDTLSQLTSLTSLTIVSSFRNVKHKYSISLENLKLLKSLKIRGNIHIGEESYISIKNLISFEAREMPVIFFANI